MSEEGLIIGLNYLFVKMFFFIKLVIDDLGVLWDIVDEVFLIVVIGVVI